MNMLHTAVVTVGCLLTVSTAGAAQEASGGGVAGRLQATRGALEAQLRRLEGLGRGAHATEQGSPASGEVAVIRARLAEGDFRVGDRIKLAVEGDTHEPDGPGASSVERQLTDTFTVGPEQELTLPVIGVVALRGVLRSELEARLRREVSLVIRDPVVHARSLIRLSVQGAVVRPGYYSLPTDAVLSDALMAAGGTGPDAKLAKLRIERDGKAIWEGEPLRRALAEGRTVDDIGLRVGDQFVVPRRGGAGVISGLQVVALVVSIPVAIYTLTRVSHD
jgi:protein involved in polysaccharide export with SLBB domain